MDLSHLNEGSHGRLSFYHCPIVARIRWKGSKGIGLNGNCKGDWTFDPTEIHLDDSVFRDYRSEAEVLRTFESNEGPIYMLIACLRLERLSINNSSWALPNGEIHPVAQAMLIKWCVTTHHSAGYEAT
jgi:hypothetical protein